MKLICTQTTQISMWAFPLQELVFNIYFLKIIHAFNNWTNTYHFKNTCLMKIIPMQGYSKKILYCRVKWLQAKYMGEFFFSGGGGVEKSYM